MKVDSTESAVGFLKEYLGEFYLRCEEGRLGDKDCKELVKRFERDFGIRMSKSEISFGSDCLTYLKSQLLYIQRKGFTVVEAYKVVQEIARYELHPEIEFSWNSNWTDFLNVGNCLTRPEPYDLVEIVWRIEEHFVVKISDDEAEGMKRVSDTIICIWGKLEP